jgi:GNAT superfamily N-acetyltransferase
MRFAHNSLLCPKNTLVKFRWLRMQPGIVCHLTPSDLEEIPRVLSEYRNTNFTLEDGLAEWKGDGYLCLAEANNTFVGIARLDKFRTFWGLSSFVIDSKYRGFGYGSKFLKHITDLEDPIYLRVKQDNQHAIQLYQNEGFETIGYTEGRYLMRTP